MILICHPTGHILFENKLRKYRHEVVRTQLTLILHQLTLSTKNPTTVETRPVLYLTKLITIITVPFELYIREVNENNKTL